MIYNRITSTFGNWNKNPLKTRERDFWFSHLNFFLPHVNTSCRLACVKATENHSEILVKVTHHFDDSRVVGAAKVATKSLKWSFSTSSTAEIRNFAMLQRRQFRPFKAAWGNKKICWSRVKNCDDHRLSTRARAAARCCRIFHLQVALMSHWKMRVKVRKIVGVQPVQREMISSSSTDESEKEEWNWAILPLQIDILGVYFWHQ